MPVGTLLMFALAMFVPVYEEPRSFLLKEESLDKVDRKIVPEAEAGRQSEQDRNSGKDPQNPRPRRFAAAADVAFTLTNSGTWQTVPDGRLWRLRIHSAGAKSLNLGITRFDM